MIRDPVRLDGRKDTQGNGDHNRNNKRGTCQLECGPEMGPHKPHRRLFMAQGFAEVTGHSMAEKPPVLQQERIVEAELLTQPLHILTACFLWQEEDGRVTRQTHNPKDQRRNAPENEECTPETTEEIAVHEVT